MLSCSNHIIKNNEILIKIKLAYEKVFSDLKKGKISYLKKEHLLKDKTKYLLGDIGNTYTKVVLLG